MRIKNRWEGLVVICELDGLTCRVLSHNRCVESIRTNMSTLYSFLNITLHYSGHFKYSHPSRGSGHGFGLQKCEARAVSPRKPCGGSIELGLIGLGLGWPAASRPGRHITTWVLPKSLGSETHSPRQDSRCIGCRRSSRTPEDSLLDRKALRAFAHSLTLAIFPY